MKQIVLFSLTALLALLVGCSKDSSVVSPIQTDVQAIQEMVFSVDSVAEFTQSDELMINDNDAIDWAKLGTDATMSSVKVFKWGRRVTAIDRNVAVTTIGDTTAIALITKVITGHFVISASYNDTAHFPDTLIRKPFQEQLQRKVIFARVNRMRDPNKNWRPVSISLVAGHTLPDSVNKFSIQQLDFYTPADTYSVTSPLETWLKLGAQRNSVPLVRHNDSLIVRLTLVSTDDSAEIAALRWTGDAHNLRLRMRLLSSTPVAGGTERVYQLTIRAQLPLGRMIGRYNVVTDVSSWGTLSDDTLPVSNALWGFPYDIRRR